MLNQLRSDLYRSWKTGVAFGFALYLVGISLLFAVVQWMFSREVQGSTVPGSFVDMAAMISFASLILPMAAGWPIVNLIASDVKFGSFKTVLAAGGDRRSYLLSKVAISAIFSVAYSAVLLLCTAALPVFFGLSYAAVPTVLEAVCWWVVASAISFGYTMLSVALSLRAPNETVAWVGFLVLTLGVLGNAANVIVMALAYFAPGVSAALEPALGYLMYAQASAAGGGLAFVSGDAALLARALLVSAGWSAVGAALGWLAFRRRSL